MKHLLYIVMLSATVVAQKRNSWGLEFGVGFPDFLHFSAKYFPITDYSIQVKLGGYPPIFKREFAFTYGFAVEAKIVGKNDPYYLNVGFSNLLLAMYPDSSESIDLIMHSTFMTGALVKKFSTANQSYFVAAGPMYAIKGSFLEYYAGKLKYSKNVEPEMRWWPYLRLSTAQN